MNEVKEDESGQVSTEQLMGKFKAVIEVEVKEEKEIDHGVTESLLVDGCVQLCLTFSQSIASSGVKEMSLESTLSSEPLLMK